MNSKESFILELVGVVAACEKHRGCDMKAIVGNHERYIRNSLRSDSPTARNSFRYENHASHNASPNLHRQLTFKKASVSFCLVVYNIKKKLCSKLFFFTNHLLSTEISQRSNGFIFKSSYTHLVYRVQMLIVVGRRGCFFQSLLCFEGSYNAISPFGHYSLVKSCLKCGRLYF